MTHFDDSRVSSLTVSTNFNDEKIAGRIMAFGFSPKHVQDFNLESSDKESFLVLAIKAASKLDWNVSFVSEKGFIAYTKFSWSS